MRLGPYLDSLSVDERKAFARRCGTSLDYLRQIAAEIRTPKAQLAIAISRESGGMVACEVLLPDLDWAYLRGARAPQGQVA